MKPVTREEQYLNRLTGEEQEIPEEPVTREEQYLARLCGQTNSIPEKPVTRREEYLANLCGEDVIIPEEQVTRMEQYMAFAAGARETKPEEPVTREEWYWDKYQGGDVPEEKTIAFTDIITVTDALARPAVDLQSEITATQNLNGYEYPWVGGAGKNLLPMFSSFTESGITATVASDGTITLNGTATADVNRQVTVNAPAGDYCFSLNNTQAVGTNARTTVYFYAVDSGGSWVTNPMCYKQNAVGSGTSANGITIARMTINSGVTLNNFVIKPQFESGSTATSYAPYSNICPISGRTEVNVTRTGKSLVNIDDIEIGKAWNGAVTNARATIFFTIKPNTQYTFSINNIDNFEGVYWVEKTTKGDTTAQRLTGPLSLSYTVTTTANTNIGAIQFNKANISESDFDNIKIQVELGSTATAFEPYEGDTFNTELGRTVYGGTLDLTTGELTITHAYVDLGDLNWGKFTDYDVFEANVSDKKSGATNFITTSYKTVSKSFTTLENGETTSYNRYPVPSIFIKDKRVITPQDFKTLVTGQKMVYELATPQTISLTPTEVMMLENNNTIWADSGRVQLTYLSKAAKKVQLMNASLKANTLKLSKGAVKK